MNSLLELIAELVNALLQGGVTTVQPLADVVLGKKQEGREINYLKKEKRKIVGLLFNIGVTAMT